MLTANLENAMRLSLKKLFQLSFISFSVLFIHLYYVQYQTFEKRNNLGDALEEEDGGNVIMGLRRLDLSDSKVPISPLELEGSVHLRQKRNVKVYAGDVNVQTSELEKPKFKKEINNTGQANVKRGSDKHRTPSENERQTELSDIFISVKTTQKYHRSRLQVLLDTWVPLARKQV